MANRILNKKAAFTLVELLTVMAIIGLLAALLLPILSAAKARAQRIRCASNLHQLGIGLQVFLENNHGYPVWAMGTNGGPAAAGDFITWAGILERDGFGISSPEQDWFQKGVWRCPSARWSSKIIPKKANYYGYNLYGSPYFLAGAVLPGGGVLTNGFGLKGHFNPDSHSWTPIQESEVAVPSEMMAIGDSFDGSAEFDHEKLGEGTPADNLLTYGNTLARHQGKANVVFCDGHVDSPTLKFLFEDTSNVALACWNRDHKPHREELSP